ncbi:MAG: hypothetical protein K1X89_08165 [Myxococcaceae bacterium]|nr:hypothetical protein [Myxococcaceae bacterium]
MLRPSLRTGLSAAVLALVAFSACPTAGTGSPTLALTASPNKIDDQGQATTLTVEALDADGKPGAGTVKITSAAGSLVDGTSVTLDAAGKATAMFSCEVLLDAKCKGPVRITAEAAAKTGTLSTTTTVQVGVQMMTTDAGKDGGSDAGVDAGVDAGIDAGTPFDAGTLDSLAQECPAGSNSLYLAGPDNGYVFKGAQHVTMASFLGVQLTAGQKTSTVTVIPDAPVQGTSWSVAVAPPTGMTLAEQTYAMSQRFAVTGVGGLDVGGNGRGCNTSTGNFKVLKYGAQGSTLTDLTVAFQQYCEGQKDNVLVGCVRYSVPVPDGGVDAGSQTLVQISTSKNALVLNTNDSLTVTALVTAADGGQPLAGVPVAFSSTAGAFVSASGTTMFTGNTNDAGIALASLFAGNGATGATANVQATALDGTAKTSVQLVNVASILVLNDPLVKTVLGIQSSGRDTTTPVLFKVVDSSNNPAPNVLVNFSVSGAAGANVTVSASSNAQGIVSTTLASGDDIGQAIVVATVAATQGQPGAITASTGISIVGGKPSDRGLVVTCTKRNLGALHTITSTTRAETTTCSARLSDRFSNFVGVKTSVQWMAEKGSIDGNTTTPGGTGTNAEVAVANYNSSSSDLPNDTTPLPGEPTNGAKNPRDTLIAVIAVTSGEEEFYDGSGTSNGAKNGKWDPGEWFVDLPEPFIDANDNNQYDNGEAFLDTTHVDCVTGASIPKNGIWDGPNGCWDANTQIWRVTHLRWSGPLSTAASTMAFSVSPPWNVPASPAQQLIDFTWGDDYFAPLSVDGPSITVNVLGGRGSASVVTGGINGDSLGMSVNYQRLESAPNPDGGAELVAGVCNELSNTSTTGYRCVRQTSFTSFGRGVGGQLTLFGAGPPGPSSGTVQFTGSSALSTSVQRSYSATFQ